MGIKRRKWKKHAREAMQGKARIIILTALFINLMNLAAGNLTAMLFPGDGAFQLLLGELFSFAITVLICVFTAGMQRMFLNISRKKEHSFGDVLYYFKHNPDRVIIASTVMALISWLTSLPASLYGYLNPGDISTAEGLRIYQIYLVLYVAGLVLNVLIAIPFLLVYYLMADDETLEGVAALKESFRMMRGHVMEYILLELSFLPWILLSIFTFYLALIWVIPYMEMTIVFFYRYVLGDRDEPTQTYTYNEDPTPYM